ncbi:MAG: hypothetical protein ACRD45_13980 [Bryobacteraceae bacterium]
MAAPLMMGPAESHQRHTQPPAQAASALAAALVVLTEMAAPAPQATVVRITAAAVLAGLATALTVPEAVHLPVPADPATGASGLPALLVERAVPMTR